jgi:hypothetical protein
MHRTTGGVLVALVVAACSGGGEEAAAVSAASASSAAPPREVMVIPWALTAEDFREQVGEVLDFRCPASGDLHRVWGTDLYSSDSSICSAAVHQGLITVAEGGRVQAELLPGAESYAASTRNGVTTSEWGEWPGSFRFILPEP